MLHLMYVEPASFRNWSYLCELTKILIKRQLPHKHAFLHFSPIKHSCINHCIRIGFPLQTVNGLRNSIHHLLINPINHASKATLIASTQLPTREPASLGKSDFVFFEKHIFSYTTLSSNSLLSFLRRYGFAFIVTPSSFDFGGYMNNSFFSVKQSVKKKHSLENQEMVWKRFWI